MRMTMAEFETRLAKHKGSLIATIVTRTRPKLLVKHRATKLPCPWPMGVERVAVRSVTLGAVYENSVNLQREREGNEDHFTAEGLWKSKEYPEGAGERDTPYTVRHKGNGKRYFGIRPKADDKGHAVVSVDRWHDIQTGLPVHPDDLDGYLSENSASKRQETEKEMSWRTVELVHVEQIRTFGEVFDIIPEPQRMAQQELKATGTEGIASDPLASALQKNPVLLVDLLQRMAIASD